MEKRTIFYLSKLYCSGIKQGEDYSKLPRVITINLLGFEGVGTDGVSNTEGREQT